MLQNSRENNTCDRVSFKIKLQAQTWNMIKKETLAQVLFSEFCGIFKSTYFYRIPLVAASANTRKYLLIMVFYYTLPSQPQLI